MQLKHRPNLLIIFDGWGYSEEIEGNAIAQANTPTWDKLWDTYPHTLISGSGVDVGLPAGQMGNSEVGHLNMGAGRMVPQDYVRINMEIDNDTFKQNDVLTTAVDKASRTDNAVHILGLLSAGGVHSHEKHIMAMIRLAAERGAKQIYLHAFLDGRDTAPRCALQSIEKIDALFAELGVGKIASVTGRYYAMDRDQRWERVEPVYNMLTQGGAAFQAATAQQAVEQAYARDEGDEFVKPTSIEPAVKINDGDSVIFMNFRADRARQLTRAFVEKDFSGFTRQAQPKLADFVTLTEYAANLDVSVAYRPQQLKNVFGAYISDLGLTQLRIAETEKYAHVTFFFNGGREEPFPGEDRILVQSPKVATYDLQPEMSADELTDKLVGAIEADKYDVIICNYANPDMVGHTGNMPAAIKAIQTVDHCLNRVVQSLQAVGGELLLTADHGNVERMHNEQTGQAHTAHTSNVVPLLYVGRPATFSEQHGSLTDVIPTMLNIMGLKQPSEMTGSNLLSIED
jgi:2,3-bisphosphoglycerate-independent phosphoglycerate mutase